jgi:ubiquinol-cytochrome c reductase cytochrome b subunit
VPSTRGGRALDWLSERLNLAEIFSLLTSYGLFYAELDTQKPFRQALREALERPAPSYLRWPRVLGIVVVVLLAIEFLTGGLLALYYLPTPESAHASTGTVLRDVGFGWLVHEIHFWGAQLLVAVLLIRLVRFLVQGVYRPPRELVWVFGALLLLVAFHADLTGRLLPWTSTAYWSTVRALETIRAVPIYGWVLDFFLAGEQSAISELTLIRFYILHVAILPALAVILIYLHFSTVRRVGLQEVKEGRDPVGRQWFRRHLIGLAIVLTVVFGLLVSLAILAAVPFQPEADPYSTVPGVRPPWYLLAPFGFLEWSGKLLPQWLAGALLFIGFSLFLVPPLPGRRKEGRGGRALVLALAALAFIAWVVFSLYGARMA